MQIILRSFPQAQACEAEFYFITPSKQTLPIDTFTVKRDSRITVVQRLKVIVFFLWQ